MKEFGSSWKKPWVLLPSLLAIGSSTYRDLLQSSYPDQAPAVVNLHGKAHEANMFTLYEKALTEAGESAIPMWTP